MILIDTSAWIEFDRATESDVDLRLTTLVGSGASIAGTEPVLMEVLAGAKNLDDASRLKRLVASFEWIPSRPASDFEAAAFVYRSCRESGVTPGGLIDCLIAAIAIRSGAYVLAHDRDFERIASVVPLRLDSYN